MNGSLSPSASGVQPYEYSSLDICTQDVRLVELLPGEPEHDIHIRIHHVTLPVLPGIFEQSERRQVKAELQATLKDGWVVRETLQGRLLFEHLRTYEPDEPYDTRWVHPFTGVDPNEEGQIPYSPSEPAFEALSHAWGPKGDDRLVFVEPDIESATGLVPSKSTIQIRRELDKALRHLRYTDCSRMLWIDMLSINQDDVSERGHQVKHMRLVYQLASRVIVWIGQEDDNSKLAFSALHHLGKQVEFVESGTWRVNSPGCEHSNWSRAAVPLPFNDTLWLAIARIVQRPWFRRLWVWQEAKLAGDLAIIKCGNDEMPLRCFGNAIWCAAVKATSQRAEVMTLLFDAGDATVPQLDGPFLTTLLRLNQKKCTDPKDRIYGALGLAPLSLASKISTDYTKSVADVYRNFCLALAKETGRMDFLLACDLAKRTINGPTWVPDWSVPIRRTARWFFSSCHASGIAIHVVKSLKDRINNLEVAGVECGVVRSVRATAPDCPDAVGSVLDDWAPPPNSAVYSTGETIFEAFIQTLRWGFLLGRFPKEPNFPTMDEAKILLQKIQSGHRASGNCVCAGSAQNPYCAATRFPECRGRTFFETDMHMGMTSAAVSVNDIVCVILGCSMPVILRPDRSGRFRIVGTSYVHGLMDAESLLGPLDKEWTVQIGAHSGWYGAINYCHVPTGNVFEEDPRLGSLPPGWEKQEAIRTPSDPLHFVRYKHLPKRMAINGDPRLLPELLSERGIPVKTISLI